MHNSLSTRLDYPPGAGGPLPTSMPVPMPPASNPNAATPVAVPLCAAESSAVGPRPSWGFTSAAAPGGAQEDDTASSDLSPATSAALASASEAMPEMAAREAHVVPAETGPSQHASRGGGAWQRMARWFACGAPAARAPSSEVVNAEISSYLVEGKGDALEVWGDLVQATGRALDKATQDGWEVLARAHPRANLLSYYAVDSLVRRCGRGAQPWGEGEGGRGGPRRGSCLVAAPNC
jgi:hypothetical protein